MKKVFFTLLVSLFPLNVFAQVQSSLKYELRGVIRDQNSTVIPGLRLQIRNEDVRESSYTDINGEFRILMSDGDYLLTADSLTPEKFRAFIRIGGGGLNPNYLEFIVDSDAIICSGNRGNPSPKVITAAEPTYPPAARAVRAGGEVSITVKITQDGKVASAKAVSGHPLLRRASEVAAEKFLFESADESTEREVVITFVFLPDQDQKPALKRYKCPYRIVVFGKVEVINATGN